MEWLFLLVGILLGAAAAWFLGRAQAKDSLDIVRSQITQKDDEIIELRRLYDQERGANIEARTQLKEVRDRLEAQQHFVDDTQQKLETAFAALSRSALAVNSDEFLKLAKTRLEGLLTDAKGDIDKRRESIDGLLKPLREALDRYQAQTRLLENSLKTDYGSLDEKLKTVAEATQQLQKETFNLGQALRAPQVKGRWGELTLRRVAELSGMSEHCDFVEQLSVDSDDGRLRPDMIVYIPGGGQIVVDSKVPLAAYQEAIGAASEEERAAHLQRHGAQAKEHVKRLSAKTYWSQFDRTPDFVVMFIPGESFFSAALEADRALMEDAMSSRIILASPTTFMALLRTVALGWRQEQIAANAAQISRLGADLYDRISRFTEHFIRVGRSFAGVIDSYNAAVGSLDNRVLVSARKFKELGATAQDDIPEVPPIDHLPRTVQTDLLPASDAAARVPG